MGLENVLARLRAYVQESFLYMRPGFAVGDDESLFDKGVIDSMGIVELIGFLESEFSVAVRDDDVSEQNLGSLTSIARYVMVRRGNGGGV
jgi:acyl carrier protein